MLLPIFSVGLIDRYRGFGSSPQSCKFKIEVTCGQSAAVFFKAPSYLDSMVSDVEKQLYENYVLCLFAPVAASIQILITFANDSSHRICNAIALNKSIARSREPLAP